jgi:tetratricopeptide (TPR) repeat protein
MCGPRRRIDELALFGLALVVRSIYFGLHSRSIYFNHPILDSLWIHQWASGLARGTWSDPDAYFRAPLYPYAVSLVYRVFAAEPWIVAVIQHVLGAVSVVLLYRIGRALGDRFVGWAAGLLLCFYWVAVFHEGEILIESLLVFLELAFLQSVLRIGRAATARSRWMGSLLSGLWLGLAAIARPNFLVWVPVAVVSPFVLRRLDLRETKSPRGLGGPGAAAAVGGRPGWREAAMVAVGVAVAIAPVTARNWVVARDRVLISSQGGLNLYVGNGPLADGRTAMAPAVVGPMSREEFASRYRDNVTIAGEQVAEAALGRPLRGSEVSAYWVGETLRWAAREPVKVLAGLLRKSYYFLNAFEISDNKNLREIQSDEPWIQLFFTRLAWVAPFASAGLVLALSQLRFSFCVVIFALLYSAAVILFFVNSRFRLPTAPFAFLLAGLAMGELVRAATTRLVRGPRQAQRTPTRAARPYLALAVGVVGGVVANTRLLDVDRERALPVFRLNRAILFMETGRCADAIEAYDDALALAPGMIEAEFGRARAYERCGDLPRAAAAFAELARARSDFPHAALGLGRVLARLERSAEADSAYRAVIGSSPDFAEARFSYADFLRQHERNEEAAREYQEGLSRSSDRLSAWINYGYTLAALDRLDEAIRAWGRALELEPGNVAAAEGIRRARIAQNR